MFSKTIKQQWLSRTRKGIFFGKSMPINQIYQAIEKYKNKYNINILVNFQTKNARMALQELSTDCLPRHELIRKQRELVVQEITTLKSPDSCGYFFTNFTFGNATNHCEVLIINEKLIKPLSWGPPGYQSIESVGFKEPLYSTTLLKAIISNQNLPMPQANGSVCATLGMLYLKELLKNNEELLKNYSLTFSYILDDKEAYYFFPAPQLLRYSQSSYYNKCILAMIESDENKVCIKHKNMECTLWSLVYLLKTKPEENKALIERFSAFREQWLKAYVIANEKRETMQKDGLNYYLDYASCRLFQERKPYLLQDVDTRICMEDLSQYLENNIKDLSKLTICNAVLEMKQSIDPYKNYTSSLNMKSVDTWENNVELQIFLDKYPVCREAIADFKERSRMKIS